MNYLLLILMLCRVDSSPMVEIHTFEFQYDRLSTVIEVRETLNKQLDAEECNIVEANIYNISQGKFDAQSL